MKILEKFLILEKLIKMQNFHILNTSSEKIFKIYPKKML